MAYTPTRSIGGSVAVITGASAGIRAATVRALVHAGANVALSARRKERLDDPTAELGENRVVGVAGDVRDAEHNEELVQAAVARWGRLDTVGRTTVRQLWSMEQQS